MKFGALRWGRPEVHVAPAAASRRLHILLVGGKKSTKAGVFHFILKKVNFSWTTDLEARARVCV